MTKSNRVLRRTFFGITLAGAASLLAQSSTPKPEATDNPPEPSKDDAPIVFRSDVALARVDAQVVDGHNRTITGLRAEDFVLQEDGAAKQIQNFASENMPVDILLLLDVSASMRPHVQRISDAGHDAFRVLAAKDRVGIMVFDTYTRSRLSFRSSRSEIDRGLEDVLDRERFNGGTQITGAMLQAAEYVRREARPEARRAIIILTDDGSQDARNEASVERALSRADAVLSFLHAPELMPQGRGGGSPGGSRTGTTWPGGGIGIGGIGGIGGMGGGRRGGGNRGGSPMGGNGNHSAGTEEIARASGGDTFPVDDASALEETLQRIRQRYALHFNSAGAASKVVKVDLTPEARRRYPDAEIRYRRVLMSGKDREAGPISITRAHTRDDDDDVRPTISRPSLARSAGSGGSSSSGSGSGSADASSSDTDAPVTPKRRRVAVDQTYGGTVITTPKDPPQ